MSAGHSSDPSQGPKYAVMYSRHFMNMARTKAMFGKPHVKVGTMFMTGAFLFQTGAMLGRHFRERARAFLLGYVVLEGHEDSGSEQIYQTVQDKVAPFLDGVENLFDLIVASELGTRMKDQGPRETFIASKGTGKIALETAFQFGWEWAVRRRRVRDSLPRAVCRTLRG